MIIESEQDLAGLRAAGHVVHATLEAMRAAVAPGVTTAALDEVAARTMHAFGARSAPRLVYDFPGATCISVNDEVVHGIPSTRRIIGDGDLVKLDVTIELDGYMADAAVTVIVGSAPPRARELVTCAEEAFRAALRVVRPGLRVRDLGRVVRDEVERHGFSVVPMLQGHGIGRSIHEDPMIPNWPDPTARGQLAEGMVITIEPIITMGTGDAHEADDGWTILSSDGTLAAHHEHTLVVRRTGPLLLTAE